MDEKKRENIDATASSLSGIGGLFETLVRKFRLLIHILFMMPMYLLSAITLGLPLVPTFYWCSLVYSYTSTWPQFGRFVAWGLALAIGFLIWGFTLLLLVPLMNFLLPTRIKPWRGIYYSLQSIPWYIHNGLTYLPRYTFLEFVTPTPFNHMFYRLMGMKMGRGAQINTTNISDPRLIELGDKVTIGGSVTIVCHYGSAGYLIIAPVKIRKGATIGLRAIIMGDVEIGENARVLPNSVVMPKTRIPAGEIWGGVPAQYLPELNKKDLSDKASKDAAPATPDNKA